MNKLFLSCFLDSLSLSVKGSTSSSFFLFFGAGLVFNEALVKGLFLFWGLVLEFPTLFEFCFPPTSFEGFLPPLNEGLLLVLPGRGLGWIVLVWERGFVSGVSMNSATDMSSSPLCWSALGCFTF